MSTTDDFKKIVKDVRGGAFKPVYFLHGEEPYFIDRIAEEIERAALQEHERDFNLTVLYGRDTDPDTVKDNCLRYPMMAERQVVVLREAQMWRIDAFDKLDAYFKSPTPTTVLVICYKHKKADGRKSWLKDLTKKNVVFVSDKLKEDKLPESVPEVRHLPQAAHRSGGSQAAGRSPGQRPGQAHQRGGEALHRHRGRWADRPATSSSGTWASARSTTSSSCRTPSVWAII
ncbi:MAG: hypothetical protein QM724_14235 [Flavobacteriales bacterium]